MQKPLEQLQTILRQYQVDRLEELRQAVNLVLNDTILFGSSELPESEDFSELRLQLLELAAYVYDKHESPNFKANLRRFRLNIENHYTRAVELHGMNPVPWLATLNKITTTD